MPLILPLKPVEQPPPPTKKSKLKVALHYGLIGLALTPQVLFAVGAVYPPAAAWAVMLQKLLSLGSEDVQPAIAQVVFAGFGAKGLRNAPPKA